MVAISFVGDIAVMALKRFPVADMTFKGHSRSSTIRPTLKSRRTRRLRRQIYSRLGVYIGSIVTSTRYFCYDCVQFIIPFDTLSLGQNLNSLSVRSCTISLYKQFCKTAVASLLLKVEFIPVLRSKLKIYTCSIVELFRSQARRFPWHQLSWSSE